MSRELKIMSSIQSQAGSSTNLEPYTLPDGSIIQLQVIQQPGLSKPSVVCDLCNTTIEKTITGGFQFFTTHRNSGRCKKAQRRELNRIPDTDGMEELREDLKRGREESSASIIRPLSKSQRLR
jgi:hypothetical protein